MHTLTICRYGILTLKLPFIFACHTILTLVIKKLPKFPFKTEWEIHQQSFVGILTLYFLNTRIILIITAAENSRWQYNWTTKSLHSGVKILVITLSALNNWLTMGKFLLGALYGDMIKITHENKALSVQWIVNILQVLDLIMTTVQNLR